MKFDYENAPRISCAKCGRKYVILPGNVTEDPYVCYQCKKDAEHDEEKARITSPDCDEDYEPFSTDDGYYCPYCEKPFEVETYVSHSFTSRRLG